MEKMETDGMKKVCMLTTVHPAFDTRIFYKEGMSLLRAGFDVTIIAQHDKSEVVNGIRLVALQKPGNRFLRMLGLSLRAYRLALRERADIYHIHDPELLPFAKLLKLSGKPVVYDMHENVPKQIKNKDWINPLLRKSVAGFVSFAEKILLLDIPVIFAEASYHKDYPGVKNYATILNMPLINQLTPLRNEFAKSEKPLIGYMGSVSEVRGSLATIEALKILKDRGIESAFDCIGTIDKAHKRQLLKLLEEYKLQGANFYGWTKPDEGWARIARCWIGLALLQPIPNYVESYPTKMFEYMALGLPVIVSDFPLWKGLVEGARCGVCVDPLNPEEIAGAIQYLIEHPAEAERMGKNGCRAVEERYNWRVEEKTLLSLYGVLLP